MVRIFFDIETYSSWLIPARKSETNRCTSILCNYLQCVFFRLILHPVINVFCLAPSVREYASSDMSKKAHLVPHFLFVKCKAYSLLSMTADGCVENENKLRDSKILGG